MLNSGNDSSVKSEVLLMDEEKSLKEENYSNTLKALDHMFSNPITKFIVLCLIFLGFCFYFSPEYRMPILIFSIFLIAVVIIIELYSAQAEKKEEISHTEITKLINKKIEENIPKQEQKNLKSNIDKQLNSITHRNLELVKIRYLIEKTINLILEKRNIPKKTYRPLSSSIDILIAQEILDKNTMLLLKNIIHICNKAIHDNNITDAEYNYVIDVSEKTVALLEDELSK